MSNQFKHFICTHVNVAYHWYPLNEDQISEYNNTSHLKSCKAPPAEWLEHRMKYFKKYCYPSIVNQKNQNFEWLVYFDDEMTNRKLLKGLDRITPIFLKKPYCWDYGKKHQQIISDDIKSRLDKDTKFVITSRLDCDDGLSDRYIEIVQKKFKPIQKNQILNFVNGYIFEERKNVVRHFPYVGTGANPFISLIEPVTDKLIKTVHYEHHTTMIKYTKPEQIKTDGNNPMWLQILHGKNLRNIPRGRPMKEGYANMERFHIDGKK